jgi:UPF0042 nucleotide-binding protein
MVDEAPRLILVTGASGAGLSTALNILEDCGVKVVDNLPLAMIDTLVAMEVEAGGRSLAFGLDARTTGFSVGAVETLVRNLRRKFPDQFTAIYLAASQDDLLRRFNATRRQHPLAAAGTLADAIAADLDRMDDISPLADIRLDTSSTKPSDLRRSLLASLGIEDSFQISLRLLSFSYRRRLPDHSDMVIDMRFAENPHWVTELRAQDGRDEAVAGFLNDDDKAIAVLQSLKAMLTEMLPRMSREGRPVLTIAFGCTGGQHRSVWAAETMARWFREQGYGVKVAHRELRDSG